MKLVPFEQNDPDGRPGLVVYLVPDELDLESTDVTGVEEASVAMTWLFTDGSVEQFRRNASPRWRGLGAHV